LCVHPHLCMVGSAIHVGPMGALQRCISIQSSGATRRASTCDPACADRTSAYSLCVLCVAWYKCSAEIFETYLRRSSVVQSRLKRRNAKRRYESQSVQSHKLKARANVGAARLGWASRLCPPRSPLALRPPLGSALWGAGPTHATASQRHRARCPHSEIFSRLSIQYTVKSRKRVFRGKRAPFFPMSPYVDQPESGLSSVAPLASVALRGPKRVDTSGITYTHMIQSTDRAP
jgi:hypothetical protein